MEENVEQQERASNNNGNNEAEQSEPEWLKKYLNRQGDWLEKTRGNLMIAATVISTMSFQMMVNPPGGVWQEDKCDGYKGDWAAPPVSKQAPTCPNTAGTSILEHSDSKRGLYIGAVVSCTVTFSASMSIILLAISGLHLRNRMLMVLMILLMLMAVVCIVFAFGFSVALVQSDNDEIANVIFITYMYYWVFFPALIIVIQLIRLVIWIVRLVFCCKRRRSRARPNYGHLSP